jgi:hypothetical protein
MKRLSIALLLLALGWPVAAHADKRGHRLAVAGVVLTAAGATLAVGGATMVSFFALNPPAIDVMHSFCGSTCPSPDSMNPPLIAGAAILTVGAAALGTGIALLVVGKRRERATIALSAGALRIRF